jgi:ABC-type multidrug transport system fused ATPase/permease subunit
VAGHSGSGKSTLVDILLGLLEPTEGRLLVDGAPVHDVRAWRKALGYVPQQIFLTDSSIAQNVAFGEDDARIDRDRVAKALREAQLAAYVAELPNGIDTMVGERGGRMSGGQRQRIGIARALYRNPRFLVLDEATSALDSATESEISETIRSLARDRSVLVVAHRLSTLKNCGQILILDQGHLVDAGTFQELEARCELFQNLVRNYFAKPTP